MTNTIYYTNQFNVWSISSNWGSATNGNDWIQVGNGSQDGSWCHAGDIYSQCGSTTTVDTGAGDDRIDLGVDHGYGMLTGHTVVTMGEGNDILNVKDNIHYKAKVLMGSGDDIVTVGEDIDDNANINMGTGNDKLSVGEDIENNAKVTLGEGNDTLIVERYLLNNASISAGTGDDTVAVGQGVHCDTTIDMGVGNDVLTVGEDIDDRAYVNLGNHNDQLTVGEDIENNAVVDLGYGKDSLYVAGNIEDCAIVKGNGIDPTADAYPFDGNTITVDGYVQNNAQVLLDKGTDVATVTGINNNAFMSFGGDNDTLTILKEFGHGCGSATVDMGTGDDLVSYGGKTLDGVINGGAGNDTLTLTYDADSSLISACCHVTNLSSKNFVGIEVIDMQGTNVVDITYQDLLKDTTNESPLFIKGNSNDKVDLGSNNWNSDSESRQNLSDDSANTNWWDCSNNDAWENSGSTIVDGIGYDIYHHTSAGADLSNDVYIQQGVAVI